MLKSLQHQNKVLKKYFNIQVPLPKKLNVSPHGEYALIPNWNKIGSTYNEAVENVLNALKKERKFYNWREGKLGPEYLRQSERKASQTLPEILPVQLGEKNRGKSVEQVRKEYAPNEIGLGAYEMAMIVLLNDDVLTKYEDLWIDCPGDEYNYTESGVRFDRCPGLCFRGDGVRFDTHGVGYVGGRFGSASGFVPQPLESSALDTFESSNLTLDSAIKIVKDAGFVIYKQI